MPVRKATQTDVLRNSAHESLGVKVGDDISPAGLYASDHDCFIFQVNENYGIDAGGGETMYRGVFWRNSEVGECRWSGTFFLYDSICGNHIVWGAKVIAEFSVKHLGNAREVYAEAMANVNRYLDMSAVEDERRIEAAKDYIIAETPQGVVNTVFNKPFNLSKRECENAYILAARHAEEHNTYPNTAWGFAAGITRLSQGTWADDRNRMDRAAGRVLEMAL